LKKVKTDDFNVFGFFHFIVNIELFYYREIAASSFS